MCRTRLETTFRQSDVSREEISVENKMNEKV